MDHPPAPSFDPALLDMENMTADKWYALIYNRIVQQEDIFVGDIKKKVLEVVNMCMNKPNSTLESVRQDITSSISESYFEFEHQNFIEGIVGGTYEYLCQFIIKNSMENIKRTQSALNCFSSSNNLNYGAIKSCNDNILLQGSSKLTQIQCLPESNNNTTDSDKAIQSFILSKNSENDSNPILMVERENIKNTTVNKMETTSLLNYKSTLQIDNLSVEPANDIPLFSNMHNNDNVDSAHSSAMIDDDEKTTEAILSIASKIEQTNFNFVDDFEADDINTSNVCTTNEIQTTKCLTEQTVEQHTDPSKLEEEYKMNNSLKLLETLVNIEHDKLEVQKSLTVNEIQPNIETNEKMRFKSSKKTNIREKKSRKLQENKHKVEEEEWLPSGSKQNRCSKNKTKTVISKSHIDKAYKKNRKSEVDNTLNHASTSDPIQPIEIENAEGISLAVLGSLFSTFKKKFDTKDSTVTNTKSLDTTSSDRFQLAHQNTIGSFDHPLKPLPGIIQNYAFEENKKILANGGNKSNTLCVKTSHITSALNLNTLDYKKLYEKDRKSLFSPDVFVTQNVPSKPSKDTTNELHKKNEHLDKKAKSKVQKDEINKKTSDRKRKLSKPTAKITNSHPKMAQGSKSKPNSKQKSSYVKKSRKNSKKLKIISSSDDEAETNAVCNPIRVSNSICLINSKMFENIDTKELIKYYSSSIFESQDFREKTPSQIINGMKFVEKIKSYRDVFERQAMPEWLRKKCELYDIKPVYVVINPFITY